MPVYAFTGLKGGVGKSTAAIGCAVEWMRRGRKTLLVDADPQKTAMIWSQVAVEHRRPIPTVISMGETMHEPLQIPYLAEQFDVVVIDTPPSLAAVTRSALMVADVAVLPCGPSTHDTWALSPVVELVAAARSVHPGLLARILVTRKVVGTAIGKTARSVLREVEIPLLESELCYRTDYQEAPAVGLGPTTYRPGGLASLEIRNLVNELEELASLPVSPRPTQTRLSYGEQVFQ